VISDKGDFCLAIDQLLRKASRAYFSIRQEFNFQNNTSPKVILKLFDSMIQPILLYGSELWALFGWKKNTVFHIQKYLFNQKLKFENLHSRMCRNTLGVHRRATEVLVKAELGRYPLLSNIIKNSYTYWQHVLNSDKTTLLHSAMLHNIENDRHGEINYYSRIKGLFLVMDCQNLIYKEINKTEIKRNANKMKSKFQEMYINYFFKTLKEKAQRPESGGRFEVYYTIKKQYKFEDYLLLEQNNLRKNITNIRISTHNLPIESLRKAKVKRKERTCPLCTSNEIGSEFHATMTCQNLKIKQLRQTLDNKICAIHNQWGKIPIQQKFNYLTLAIDKQCTFYFAIFLDKVYREYKTKK
jgi:hypothetical protein